MGEQPEHQERIQGALLATPWTSERRELHNWFQAKAPALADAYEGAVRLLSVPGFPGRVHLVSHVARDICNRLPDFLCSIERVHIQYDRELGALDKLWPDSVGPSGADYGDSKSEVSGDSDVRIPRAAAAAVSLLLKKNRDRQTNRDIADNLFALVAEATPYDRVSLGPIVAEFCNTSRWFTEHVHLRMEPMDFLEQDELVRKFEQFERIALSLVRDFFRTKDELDGILQQANTTTG
jgi:hypothetical protein